MACGETNARSSPASFPSALSTLFPSLLKYAIVRKRLNGRYFSLPSHKYTIIQSSYPPNTAGCYVGRLENSQSSAQPDFALPKRECHS